MQQNEANAEDGKFNMKIREIQKTFRNVIRAQKAQQRALMENYMVIQTALKR